MQDVVILAEDFGLHKDKAREIELGFAPSIQSMNELKPEYDRVMALSISEETCEEAKELRLKFVKIRTNTGRIHKALKAYYLAGGRFVDAWKNKQLTVSEEIEAKLQDIELHFERIEEAKNEARKVERLALLAEIEQTGEGLDVLNMEPELWDRVILGMQKEYSDRKAKEEADRMEEELLKEAARVEAIRIKEENDKLKKDQEAKDKALAKVKAKAKADADKAAERERKLKADADALRKEKEAEEEAERKRVADQIAEKKRLAKAGDKEKLKAFFSVLGKRPKLSDKDLAIKVDSILSEINSICEG